MCVILHRVNSSVVDKQDIIDAYEYNPDGCGLMYKINNKVVTQKGLWSLDYLLDKLHCLGNINYCLHLRIRTKGDIDYNNCHPFSLGKGNFMMHNGTFKVDIYNENMSDTWHVAQHLKTMKLNKVTFAAFAKHIESNRVVFMGKKGVKRLGNWGTHKGNYWSNLNWMDYFDKYEGFDRGEYQAYDDYYMKYHDYQDAFTEYCNEY